MLAVKCSTSALAGIAEIKFKNVYLASYADEWRPPAGARTRRLARQIYAWKRGKPVAGAAGSQTPGPFEVAGEVVYHTGFAGYFVLRFVNLALLGASPWPPGGVIANGTWQSTGSRVAAAGYAVPLLSCLGPHCPAANGGKHRTFTG